MSTTDPIIDSIDKDLKKEISELSKMYLVVPSAESFSEVLNNVIEPLPDGLRQIAEAFHHNLNSVIKVLTIPAYMAVDSVMSFILSEHAYSKVLTMPNLDKDLIKESVPDFFDKYINSFSTKEGLERSASHIINLMKPLLQKEKFAFEELLRQGLVLAWSCFEIVAHDSSVWLLNTRSDLWKKLRNDTSCNSFIPLKNISLKIISDMGYDLNGKIGDYLIGRLDFSNLKTIRTISNCLCPNLNKDITAPALWILNNRRHLIVHRLGRVDSKYIKDTGEVLNIGEQLIITSKDLFKSLELVRDTAIKLITAVLTSSSDT